MGLSRGAAESNVVADPVHGSIRFTDPEKRVIDTASFQRLRRLKQLGMGQVTYPNAVHSRFAHSIGALAIMRRVLEIVPVELSNEQIEELRLAALLHDIGHYPYSHLMEQVERVQLTEEFVGQGGPPILTLAPYPKHDLLGAKIVTSQTDLLKAIGDGGRAKKIADLFTGAAFLPPYEYLSKLVSSSLDIDRIDYLLRDSHAAGVPYGMVDWQYLLNCMQITDTGIVGFSEKALPAAEQFLLARFFMHKTVYYHKTTFGMEEVCRQLLRRIRDKCRLSEKPPYDLPIDGEGVMQIVSGQGLTSFTDAFVDSIIQQATEDDDVVIRALARAIQNRRPPKLLKEVPVLYDHGSDESYKGRVFAEKCRNGLEQLATRARLPLGQFLFCDTPPLRLESRPTRFASDEVNARQSGHMDKDVMIFLDGKDEPTSIVEVPHSIVGKCADCAFRAYRLYVVCDGQSRMSLTEGLAEQVSDWG